MTKPILRLGPAEELDDEYDPLLGRVVRDNERSSADVWVSPELTRDPFDPDAPPEAMREAIEEPITEAGTVPEAASDAPATSDALPPGSTPSPFDESWPEPASPPPSIYASEANDPAPLEGFNPASAPEDAPSISPGTSQPDHGDPQKEVANGPQAIDPLFDPAPVALQAWADDETAHKKQGWLSRLFGRFEQKGPETETEAEAEAVTYWQNLAPAPKSDVADGDQQRRPEDVPSAPALLPEDAQARPDVAVETALPEDQVEDPPRAADTIDSDLPAQAEPEPAPQTDDGADEGAAAALTTSPLETLPPATAMDTPVDDEDSEVPSQGNEETAPPPPSLPSAPEPVAEEAAQAPLQPDTAPETAPETATLFDGPPEQSERPDPASTVPAGDDTSIEPPNGPVDVSQEAPLLDQTAVPPEQILQSPARPKSKRRRKRKKNYLGAFFGTMLFGMTFLFTLASSFAVFGFPWDALSSYRWVWVALGLASVAVWAVGRGWRMVLASAVVTGLNLIVTIPAAGVAPKGSEVARAVIGWANVEGSEAALQKVMAEAERNQASLVMLAEAPVGVMRPPAGWALIEAPVPGDPTAIAVLSKANWQAVTVAGEPTMARPVDGALTVIGVHPIDAAARGRQSPQRDALINRAANRAGIQEGPTIVVGDFDASSWDRSMKRFTEAGAVERVRCGGWAGSTEMRVFGIIGVAVDHAFVRDVQVTHCRVGSVLPQGSHKPLWLYVAPKAPAQEPQP
jgi:hypothetical protein